MAEKVKFDNGDKVIISGLIPEKILYGIIIGLVSKHSIDYWIVKLDKDSLLPDYTYEAITVPHTLLVK